MAYEQATSGLLAGIDKALAQLEAQAKELQAATTYGSAQCGAAAPAAAGAPFLDDMALTMSHLKQIKILYPQNKRETCAAHRCR
jgi:hypothetical protein